LGCSSFARASCVIALPRFTIVSRLAAQTLGGDPLCNSGVRAVLSASKREVNGQNPAYYPHRRPTSLPGLIEPSLSSLYERDGKFCQNV
jgi:hypothetical protein